MKNQKTSVYIYVKQAAQPDQIQTICESLRMLNGVITVAKSPRVDSMINVDYDPVMVDSQYILNRVHQQQYSAHLVGM